MKRIEFRRPWIGRGEQDAARCVLASERLTHGPHVRTLEVAFAEFVGAGAAHAAHSGTAALDRAWRALDLPVGSEVLVPALAPSALARAIERADVRPVFVGPCTRGGHVEAATLEALVGPATAAVAVHHLFGFPAEIEPIERLCRERGLALMEDCGQALGASSPAGHVGRSADVACFAFGPAHHITTGGDGGMIVTSNPAVADRLARGEGAADAAPGVRRDVWLGSEGPAEGDAMSELQAAIGIEQMARLPGLLTRRRENHRALAHRLGESDAFEILDGGARSAAASPIGLVLILDGFLAEKRAELVDRLDRDGIGCVLHRTHPMPAQGRRRTPVAAWSPAAERIARASLILPVHPRLDRADLERIAVAVRRAVAALR